jgi:glycosyltransferase involved in cell wall biosynthesis
MNNLIIFATYWNEIGWVKPSLEQIDKLDPIEVIICDGCFDPLRPVPSTDGTREIIESYVAGRENARMISPVRRSLPAALLSAIRGHGRAGAANIFKPARWKGVMATLMNVAYRRNQALTFNRMIGLSRLWKPDRWFMAYDADQFYPDAMIGRFAEMVNSESDYDLLTAREYTFFEDFHHYTDAYEKRTYNNMPHRIHRDTTFIPTRGIIIEEWRPRGLSPKGILSRELYVNRVKALDVGIYHHYKLTTTPRYNEGYDVGGRRKPDVASFPMKPFEGEHPSVIQKYFDVSRTESNL